MLNLIMINIFDVLVLIANKSFKYKVLKIRNKLIVDCAENIIV